MRIITSHKAVVAARKHDSGVVVNERKGMSMEIAEHDISLPATDDTNFLWIGATKKERQCAAGSKRASGNILLINVHMPWYGEGCHAEETCDHSI